MYLRAILSVIALSAMANHGHAAWQHARGDSANTGFQIVDTAPARSASVHQPLGPIAPGTNPVVAPDGTVYIGNLEGEVRAFHADGTPYWTRKLNSPHGGIFSAPVIGADGSIYVVSIFHYIDHRSGVINHRNDSFLHKFLPGGGWVFAIPFPEQFSAVPSVVSRGATNAPPTIWRWNETEAIIVPTVYVNPAHGRDLRLIAFSTGGALIADALVTQGSSPATTGGSSFDDEVRECVRATQYTILFPFLCPITVAIFGKGTRFHGDYDDEWRPPTLPGAAIRPDRQAGPPLVMVVDTIHDKIAAYAFSPETGFSEVQRYRRPGYPLTTAPVVLPNGSTLTGSLDGTLIGLTYDFNAFLSGWSDLGASTGAPLTRLADGSRVVVSGELMTVLGSRRRQVRLVGKSTGSAAASCNYFYVATSEVFATFDAKTLMEVASVPWASNGWHAPVIGPSGHVYAIASNTLHVFPPPWRPIWDTRPPSCALLPPVTNLRPFLETAFAD